VKLRHVEELFEVTVMFWLILSVFFLCNGLLVWGVLTQRRDPYDRPPVMTTSWFRLATMIGGMGWVIVPVMCFSAFGLLGAAAGSLAYLLSSTVISLPIVGGFEGGIAPTSG
jgi:hypothetical protein